MPDYKLFEKPRVLVLSGLLRVNAPDPFVSSLPFPVVARPQPAGSQYQLSLLRLALYLLAIGIYVPTGFRPDFQSPCAAYVVSVTTRKEDYAATRAVGHLDVHQRQDCTDANVQNGNLSMILRLFRIPDNSTAPHERIRRLSPQHAILVELQAKAVPREDGEVAGLSKDLLLETPERALALSVQQLHHHAEDAHEAVSDVFDAAGVAVGCPGHALRHVASFELDS